MQMENTRDWDLIRVLANCVYVVDCRSALVPFYYVKGYELQLCLYFLMWLFHSHIALTLHNNVTKIVSVNEISYIICSFIYRQLKFWQYPISSLNWQHQLCGIQSKIQTIKLCYPTIPVLCLEEDLARLLWIFFLLQSPQIMYLICWYWINEHNKV